MFGSAQKVPGTHRARGMSAIVTTAVITTLCRGQLHCFGSREDPDSNPGAVTISRTLEKFITGLEASVSSSVERGDSTAFVWLQWILNKMTYESA